MDHLSRWLLKQRKRNDFIGDLAKDYETELDARKTNFLFTEEYIGKRMYEIVKEEFKNYKFDNYIKKVNKQVS